MQCRLVFHCKFSLGGIVYELSVGVCLCVCVFVCVCGKWKVKLPAHKHNTTRVYERVKTSPRFLTLTLKKMGRMIIDFFSSFCLASPLRFFPHFLYLPLVIRLFLFRLPSLLPMLADGTVWNVPEWGRNRLSLTRTSHVRSFPEPSVNGGDELSASHLSFFASKEVHIGNHWIRGL